jgi:radical SAM protein with 4Fe4S-binding SPASM domain
VEPFQVDSHAQALLVERARRAVVPLGVHIDVTWECDLACVHCYLAERKRPELTLDEYRALFAELRALGTLHMLISGGEIFHRPDGLDIVREARANRFEVRLITHGGHIDDAVADELARIGIAAVAMSLYSADAAVHDAITKVPGSWQRTTDAARRLVARGVPTMFKCVLMTENRGAPDGMRALGRELGVGVEFGHDVKGDNEGSDALLALNLDPAEKIAMLGCVYPTMADSGAVPFYSPDEYTCLAGNASCYISPDGTVQPCLDWAEEAGNVREKPMATIWRESPVFRAARTIRRSSFSGCSSCESFSHCSLCPARAHRETGSTTGSAPSRCRDTMSADLARAELRAKVG